MKFSLLHGRSGAHSQPEKRKSLRLATGLLFAAFCLPAMASNEENLSAQGNVLLPLTVQPGPSALTALPAAQLKQAHAATSPATDSGIQKLLKSALALLGTPYRWGGTTTEGFDCSGLVGYVFRTALGVELPRVSRDMATRGERVSREQMAEGDLVFFSRSGGRIDHVGIYLGNGQFVHAPRTGRDVSVSRLDTGYWAGKFMQARRVANGS